MPNPTILQIAFNKPAVKRAALIASLVGTVLAVINHGDWILLGALDRTALVKIGLTYLVPFSVSMTSSILAAKDCQKLLAEQGTAISF